MPMGVHQTTEFLPALLSRIKAGGAVPAAFQRPWRWNEEDVEALWDSILLGLPIGSILLWTPEDADVKAYARPFLGPIELNPERHAALILDGQHRLVTMAWSATHPDAPVPEGSIGVELWRSGRTLVADPYERRIRFVDDDQLPDRLLLPVHHLCSTLQRWLRKAWDGNETDLEHVEWLNSLESNLIATRVIVTTLERSTPAEARSAFLRISRAGVPMTQEDFDSAINWAPVY